MTPTEKAEEHRQHIGDTIFSWYNEELAAGMSISTIHNHVQTHVTRILANLVTIIEVEEAKGNYINPDKLSASLDTYLLYLGVALKKIEGAVLDPSPFIHF